MELRHEPLVVETNRYRIEGTVTLPAEGYRSRLSDYMNQRDRDFLAIQDAVVTPLDDPGSASQVPFLMVARQHLTLVMPGSGEAP